jgi:hypothetical protein
MKKLIISLILMLTVALVAEARVTAPLIVIPKIDKPVVKSITPEVSIRAELPQDVQDLVDQVDVLISEGKQKEANAAIMQWLIPNHAALNYDIGVSLFSRYVIEADDDPVVTIQNMGQLEALLTPEQTVELAPVIQQIKSKYSLGLIDTLIAAGRNAEANMLIAQYLFLNVSSITFEMGAAFLSKFDLGASEDPVVAIQQIAALYDLLNDQQKSDLFPIMQQIKTKYDLIKDTDDPDVLALVDPTAISIVTIETITLAELNLILSNIESLDLASLNVLLTKLDTLDLASLNVLLTKLDTLDLASLELLLNKIGTIDVGSLDLILANLDTVTADVVKVLIVKLGNLNEDQLELLLAKLNKYGVEDAADIIYGISTYGELASTHAMILDTQIDYWQSIYTRIDAAKKEFDFYTHGIKVNEDTLPIIESWAEVSKNVSEIAYIPWDASFNNLRMIGEVKTPTNDVQEANQEAELDFFINKLGYNTLFVVSEMEDPVYLKQLIEAYKAQGVKIGIVIGQQETNPNIYQSIDAMEYIYSQLAPIADFAFLGWRRTSLPHFGEWQNKEEDEGTSATSSDESRAYALVQAHLIRKYNANIHLIGERFYFVKGATSYSHNYPWTSASTVLGLGTKFVNTRGVIKSRFSDDICIPLVVGPNYYYVFRPQYSTGLDLSRDGILRYRQEIEQDVLKASNIPMTLTIVGDMTGERFGNTDSLTKSEWRIK